MWCSRQAGGKGCAIQRDLDRLERWACANFMNFNKAKVQDPTHVSGNPNHKYRLGRKWIESSPVEKDLGISMNGKLTMSQQCALTAQKANRVLGCIKRNVTSRSREGIHPPLLYCCETPPLQCCVQLWGHQHKKDTDLFKRVQRRP